MIYVIHDEEQLVKDLTVIGHEIDSPVASFQSGRECLYRLTPDVEACLIINSQLIDMSGLQLIKELKQIHINIPTIVTTRHPDISTAVETMKQGVIDYLEYPVGESILRQCVQKAMSVCRKIRRSEQAQHAYESRFKRLSPRERQVMDQLVNGSTNKKIAYELSLSEKTIAAHRSNILNKMDVGSLQDLVRISITVSNTADEPETQSQWRYTG